MRAARAVPVGSRFRGNDVVAGGWFGDGALRALSWLYCADWIPSYAGMTVNYTQVSKEEGGAARGIFEFGPLREPRADGAERREFGADNVAGANVHCGGDGAGHHEIARPQLLPELREFVRAPRDGVGRVAQNLRR